MNVLEMEALFALEFALSVPTNAFKDYLCALRLSVSERRPRCFAAV
jgi:hypothetical protein